jgi:hypothetical protein
MMSNTITSQNSVSKSPKSIVSPTGYISNAITKYTTLSPGDASSVVDTSNIQNLRAKKNNRRISKL